MCPHSTRYAQLKLDYDRCQLYRPSDSKAKTYDGIGVGFPHRNTYGRGHRNRGLMVIVMDNDNVLSF